MRPLAVVGAWTVGVAITWTLGWRDVRGFVIAVTGFAAFTLFDFWRQKRRAGATGIS